VSPANRTTLAAVHPRLHFAHANGFPGACYSKLFGLLSADFAVGYLPASGHDPRFPVSDGWPWLVEELIASIAGSGQEPVLGIGHSLGGFLTLMAAVRRPDLFRAVLLLDAPILSRFAGSALQLIKLIGLTDRVTLAGITKNRRRTWPTQEAALAHFRRKRRFRSFDPDCLLDYIRYGTVPDDHGVRLAFDPAVEYRIYRTIPHDIHAVARRLQVPAGFIGGRSSDVLKRTGLAATRRHMLVTLIDGGHLFPLQVPWEAAAAIRAMAKQLSVL
jgi:pimeloyl-ACP methyl ester carboxylesterase